MGCSSVCAGLSLAPSHCGSRALAGRQPLPWKGFPPSRPHFSNRDSKSSLLSDLCSYPKCAVTAVPVKEPDFNLSPAWQGRLAEPYRANLLYPSNRGEQCFLVWWEESKESLAPYWQPSPSACHRTVNTFLTRQFSSAREMPRYWETSAKGVRGKTNSQGETNQSSGIL